MSGTPTVYELNHGSILQPATECRGIASDPPFWPYRGGGAQPRPTTAARWQGTAAPHTMASTYREQIQIVYLDTNTEQDRYLR